MISSLDARTVATNYASHQLTLGKKTVYLPKLPHMAKMYSQLPDLGQMKKIHCILMWYIYEVYHNFDTTTLQDGTILYNNIYHNIYVYIGIQVYKVYNHRAPTPNGHNYN